MHTPTALGVRIKARLDEMERSTNWFARKMGLEGSHVHRWLTGERPILRSHIPKIAEILGVSEESLLMPEDEAAKRPAA
jgi:transcriptional regulator with XRE-family HTH domain